MESVLICGRLGSADTIAGGDRVKRDYSRLRARLLAGSAICGGTFRGLSLAAGVAATMSLSGSFAFAADYAAGGGVNNAPSGFATAVGSGAATLA
jgi:hypothetical protein